MSRIIAVTMVYVYCCIAWNGIISYRVDCAIGIQGACEHVQGLYK